MLPPGETDERISLHDVGVFFAKVGVGAYSVIGRALLMLVAALAMFDFVGLKTGLLPPWVLPVSLGLLVLVEYVMYLLVRIVEKDISLSWGEAQEGCCPACGYDMRGTLAAGHNTCPECGLTLTHRPPWVRSLSER